MKDRYVAQRRRVIEAPPSEVYRVFTGLGSKRGWLAFDWVWQLRAAIDLLVGGIGMRRGRRHPDDLIVGDTVDFWRVEALVPDRLLRLHAEMLLPGEGWLQFKIEEQDNSTCCLIQTAFFVPADLLGHFYWAILVPIHFVIYSTLIRRIAEIAEHNHQVASGASNNFDLVGDKY